MILVDTSVWIDHLHQTETGLTALMAQDRARLHPLTVQELAVGTLSRRQDVLALLDPLTAGVPVLSHSELLAFVEANRLWGLGLSAVDAHLLGSTRLIPTGRLWTRDKRLLACAQRLSLAHL
ncbi:MAG: VapC toxin family PIN domain ribonuclease [Propionibacteriaceae bacterium]|jgi:predicted nucleic acid-binding protein|nr:VapC toxin family PIN domain ribonuclease [Propionibacteriaceae bacterium]